MNLVIDIGNSFSKVALFKGRELQKLHFTEGVNKQLLLDLIKDEPEKVRHVILSAVKPYPSELDDFFKGCFRKFLRMSHELAFPLKLAYKTPETLGMDRLAAVVGGLMSYPGERLLVIDAGTCITYDFLNDNLIYEGGAISPGLNMRFKALHTFTGQLPLISWVKGEKVELTGDSTGNAIRSGVIKGSCSEVDGVIDQYRERYPGIRVLLTGGDMEIFDKELKNRIFANPNLVLVGLNEILRYNIED